ncbi:hypothetical protein TNCV_4047061 [Trichonephila clavipes]|nr:hypothetical protein TNCV_4047061 [Trichonephila clavipes]
MLPVLVWEGFSLSFLTLFSFFVFVLWRVFSLSTTYGPATGNSKERIVERFVNSCSLLTIRHHGPPGTVCQLLFIAYLTASRTTWNGLSTLVHCLPYGITDHQERFVNSCSLLTLRHHGPSGTVCQLLFIAYLTASRTTTVCQLVFIAYLYGIMDDQKRFVNSCSLLTLRHHEPPGTVCQLLFIAYLTASRTTRNGLSTLVHCLPYGITDHQERFVNSCSLLILRHHEPPRFVNSLLTLRHHGRPETVCQLVFIAYLTASWTTRNGLSTLVHCLPYGITDHQERFVNSCSLLTLRHHGPSGTVCQLLFIAYLTASRTTTVCQLVFIAYLTASWTTRNGLSTLVHCLPYGITNHQPPFYKLVQ